MHMIQMGYMVVTCVHRWLELPVLKKLKEGYQLLNFNRKVFQLGQFGHYGRIALDELKLTFTFF